MKDEPLKYRTRLRQRRRILLLSLVFLMAAVIWWCLQPRTQTFNASLPSTVRTTRDNAAALKWATAPVEELPKLKVHSSHHCYNTPHGFGVLDVLGSGFTTSHYCVVTNVCVDFSSFVLFDDSRVGQRYEFPRQPLLQEKFTVYEGHNAPTLSRAMQLWKVLDPSKTVLERGVTVLMRHAYCCGHIRHFLEPLSTLRLALEDLSVNATRRAALGEAQVNSESRIIVDRVMLAPSTSPSGPLHERNMLALRAALMPSVPRLDDFTVDQMPLRDFGNRVNETASVRCFESAIVPGSDYNSYHGVTDGVAYRDDLYRVLSPRKWAEYRKTNDSWWIANEDPATQQFKKNESERIILVSVRDSKRSIVDMPLLIEWIKEFAGGVRAIVKIIEFGKHSALSQAVHSQEADILVALHGADLTNLMFQRSGAMVIELNPIFFFESGYYVMAERLNIHYDAWTCTAPTCAFADNAQLWDTIFTESRGVKFNKATRVMSVADSPYQNFTWPPLGYAGRCEPCDHFPALPAFRDHFYGTLRDSKVKIAEHKVEFVELFRRAFVKLRWV